MSKTSLFLTSAIVAAGLAISPSFAAKYHPPVGKHQTTAVKLGAGAMGKKGGSGSVLATVLNSNSFTGTVASGFTPVADLTVTAKKAGTLALSGMIQYCGFSGEYTTPATDVIGLVDGTYVDGGPFQSPVRTDDICIVDNWQGIYAVAAGSHTVEFDAYSYSGDIIVGRSTERVDLIKG